MATILRSLTSQLCDYYNQDMVSVRYTMIGSTNAAAAFQDNNDFITYWMDGNSTISGVNEMKHAPECNAEVLAEYLSTRSFEW